jgi:CxxC motif-containing protein (DUF1111 family)
MRTLKATLLAFTAKGFVLPIVSSAPLPDAPAAFDGKTNGFVSQAEFDQAQATFVEQEGRDEGLGPVYNAQSCGECHQSPSVGGISQVTELRAGHFDGFRFIEHPGGSLINDRAVNASIQERVLDGNEVRTFRTSLNTLGDGFVECIDSNTLVDIANSQPFGMRGQFIQVPVLEAGNRLRGGRFGWKNQHASLLSFSADAYKNEMGITNRLDPLENTSNGKSVAAFDGHPEPEDTDDDLDAFATYMRSTKAPPRDTVQAATADARAGDTLFTTAACDTCHLRSITTSPPGTVINQGAFTVPAALGNKTIHPFGDFLLHDVGTGDGIVQNGGQSTRNRLRTAPLWGVRTRTRLMHDGASLTFNDAILRHAGQAQGSSNVYRSFTATQKKQLVEFLKSL